MRIKFADEAPKDVLSYYFHENPDFCEKVKDIFGITIVPTLDKTAFDPKDSFNVVKMPKINFGSYDHMFVKHFNVEDGSEPFGYIMVNMFREFLAANDIKRGDVILGLGIFELACIIDPLTLDVKKAFFLRGLINGDVVETYRALNALEVDVSNAQ